MSIVSRRSLLAGTTATIATTGLARAQAAKPKVTVISQWSAGSDGLAITTLGKRFETEGGVWEHNPVPGFTTDMMNKLRAQIIAGDPPAASQLKGPEIAAWSKIGAVVDLDDQVKDAGYESVVRRNWLASAGRTDIGSRCRSRPIVSTRCSSPRRPPTAWV